MQKKIIGGIIGLIVIGVGYWLISPLFIDREVDESLSPELEDAVNQAIDQFTGSLEEQLDPEMMDAFKAEMEGMEDKEMTEPMPDSIAPAIVSFGSFVDVAHHGTGQAKVIDLRQENGFIVRLQDLDVSNGPDLRVLLSKSKVVKQSLDLGEYIELGKLKGNKGTQNYVIPEGTDVREYQSVVIYCKPFHVVFNSASLSINSFENQQKTVDLGDAETVVGGWTVEEADAGYSSITFFKDGTYISHLNERPFDSGLWTFKDGTLTVSSDVDSAFSEVYTNVSIDDNELVGANNGVAYMLTRMQ